VSQEVVEVPDIDGVGRALRDAAERGVLDRDEVDSVVERWKEAERALDDAVGSPMPERDANIKAALQEYNDSTAEVTKLYLRAL
jgi:hypothetical protein